MRAFRQVPRFVANSHRLVGGVLFDQTRAEMMPCNSTENMDTLSHVDAALKTASQCVTGALEVEAAGSDPVFDFRSELYDSELQPEVCHPTDALEVRCLP